VVPRVPVSLFYASFKIICKLLCHIFLVLLACILLSDISEGSLLKFASDFIAYLYVRPTGFVFFRLVHIFVS